jgi:hypothetical protein
LPAELDPHNRQALTGILGLIQLVVRLLFLVLLFPGIREHQDHQNMISTFNAYRQTLTFAEDYLAQAERR